MTQRNSLIKSDELHIVSFVALANAALTDCVSVRHTAGQAPDNKGGEAHSHMKPNLMQQEVSNLLGRLPLTNAHCTKSYVAS